MIHKCNEEPGYIPAEVNSQNLLNTHCFIFMSLYSLHIHENKIFSISPERDKVPFFSMVKFFNFFLMENAIVITNFIIKIYKLICQLIGLMDFNYLINEYMSCFHVIGNIIIIIIIFLLNSNISVCNFM